MKKVSRNDEFSSVDARGALCNNDFTIKIKPWTYSRNS